MTSIDQGQDDAGTYILKKLGFYSQEGRNDAYLDINIKLGLQLIYFNPRSLAFEPFIESWSCISHL